MDYKNPKHPLDLSYEQFEMVRNYFQREQMLRRAMNMSEQIKIEDFSQFLSPQLKINPMVLTKILRKYLSKSTICWGDFQQILDTESNLREEILDFIMFEQQTQELELEIQKTIKPDLKEKDQRNQIKLIQHFSINNKLYYMFLFDDRILCIVDSTNFDKFHEQNFNMKKSEYNQIPSINKVLLQQSNIQAVSNQQQQPQDMPSQRRKKFTTNKNQESHAVTERPSLSNQASNLFQNSHTQRYFGSEEIESKLKQILGLQTTKNITQIFSGNDEPRKQKRESHRSQDRSTDRLHERKKSIIKQNEASNVWYSRFNLSKILVEQIKLKKMSLNFQNRPQSSSNNQQRRRFSVDESSKLGLDQFQVFKILRISGIILKFIEKLKNAVRQRRVQQAQKLHLKIGDETYQNENRDKIHELFVKFKELPQEVDLEYVKVINQLTHHKQIHKIAPKSIQQINPALFSNDQDKLEQSVIPKQGKLNRSYVNPRSKSLASTRAPSTSRTHMNYNPNTTQQQQIMKEMQKTTAPINYEIKTGQQLADSFLKEALTDRQYLNIDPRKLKYRQKPKLTRSKITTTGLPQDLFLSHKNSPQRLAAPSINQSPDKKQIARDREWNCISLKYQKYQTDMQDLSVTAFQVFEEEQIFGVGLMNRVLKVFSLSELFVFNTIKKRQTPCFQMIFASIVVGIQFLKNKISQKLNMILIFENRTLQVFEFHLIRYQNLLQKKTIKNSALESDTNLVDLEFNAQAIFRHKFDDDVVNIYKLSCGFVVTNFSGDLSVFQDQNEGHPPDYTTTNSSSYFSQVWKTKIKDEGQKCLQLTGCAYCDSLQILILGTTCGKIVQVSVLGKQILGVYKLGTSTDTNLSQEKGSLNGIMEVFVNEEMKSMIVVTQNRGIYLYEIMTRNLIQYINTDLNQVGINRDVQSSFYCKINKKLLVAQNILTIYSQVENENLEKRKKKLQNLIQWRKNDENKQNFLKKNFWDSSNQSQLFAQVQYSKEFFFLLTATNFVRVYNLKTYKLSYSFQITQNQVLNIDLQNQRNLVLLCSQTGEVSAMNMHTFQTDEIKYEQYPQKIHKLKFITDCVLYDVACMTLDGKIILINSNLRELNLQQNVKSQILGAHSKAITHLINNREYLITASDDLTIAVWIMNSFQKKHQIIIPVKSGKQHSAPIQKMQFLTEKPNHVICLTEEAQIFIFNAQDGSIYTNLINLGERAHATFSSKGDLILALNNTNQILVYKQSRSLEQPSQTESGASKKSIFDQESFEKLKKQQKKEPSTTLMPPRKSQKILAMKFLQYERQKSFQLDSPDVKTDFYKLVIDPITLDKFIQFNDCLDIHMLASQQNVLFFNNKNSAYILDLLSFKVSKINYYELKNHPRVEDIDLSPDSQIQNTPKNQLKMNLKNISFPSKYPSKQISKEQTTDDPNQRQTKKRVSNQSLDSIADQLDTQNGSFYNLDIDPQFSNSRVMKQRANKK